MGTFETSVETFLKGADWLDDSDQPGIVALREIARLLDEQGMSVGYVKEFGLAHRALLRKREKGNEDFNGDEDFLNRL